MTVCGGSWPSPQGFRQASPLSPLQLLATSPTPFTHTNTRNATGSLPLDHNKQHCEFTHVLFSMASLLAVFLTFALWVVYLHTPAVLSCFLSTQNEEISKESGFLLQLN